VVKICGKQRFMHETNNLIGIRNLDDSVGLLEFKSFFRYNLTGVYGVNNVMWCNIRLMCYVDFDSRMPETTTESKLIEFGTGIENKKLSYRRETARQLRIHAQLTRCFSAVAV